MRSRLQNRLVVICLFLLLAALGLALPLSKILASGTAGKVIAAGHMSVPRFSQTATLLPSGRVLIAGGMERNGVYLATTELFDPSRGSFSPAGRMTTARACHTATQLPSGRVLLAGGSDGSWKHLATSELYDPATGRFTPTGNLTTARCGAVAIPLRTGKVLVVGGMGTHEYERLATAELYDPATGSFTPTGSMQVPRDAHAGVLLADGRVLVVGGASAGRFPNETIEASAEIYDPASGRFMPTGSMVIPRYKLAAVLLDNGRTLIVGGSDNRAWRGEYSSAELYDPAAGKFTAAGNMNFKRYKLPRAVVRLKDGRILIAGGAERAEVYDPRSSSFLPTAGSKLDGFCFSTATLLANGLVLMVGGYGDDPGSGGVSGAWLYEP